MLFKSKPAKIQLLLPHTPELVPTQHVLNFTIKLASFSLPKKHAPLPPIPSPSYPSGSIRGFNRYPAIAVRVIGIRISQFR